MTHTVFLALGTNLGDRSANLRTAIAALVVAARNWKKLRAMHSEHSPKVEEALTILLAAAQAID